MSTSRRSTAPQEGREFVPQAPVEAIGFEAERPGAEPSDAEPPSSRSGTRPERVVEVRYDHMEGERFRHTAQFNRWRPDRDPRSSTYAQFEHPVTFSLRDIVPGLSPGSTR